MSFFHHKEIDVVARAIAQQYYVLLQGETLGPYPTEELRRITGFTLQTPVRTTPLGEWKPAFTVLDLGAYFGNTKQADWEENASRLLAQKRKQRRKQHWHVAVNRTFKFLNVLVFLFLCGILAVMGTYALRLGNFHQIEWRAPLESKAHQGLQWTIHSLQNLDSKYFSVTVSAQHPANPPSAPRAIKRPVRYSPKSSRPHSRKFTVPQQS